MSSKHESTDYFSF